MKLFLPAVVFLASGPATAFNKPFESVPELMRERWTKIAPVDANSTIDLVIVLSNPNTDALEHRAMQIATPFSGHYRKHLTAVELADWVKPSSNAVMRVQTWLSAHGIEAAQNHDLLETEVPVSKIEALLNTQYYYYYDDDGRVVKRTDQYYVPGNLANLIEFIHPTVNFPYRKTSAQNITESGEQDAETIDTEDLKHRDNSHQHPCTGFYITPKCVEHYYNVTYTAPVDTNVSVEDSLLDGGAINKTDLYHYLQLFNPAAARAHPTVKVNEIGAKLLPDEKFLSEQDVDVQTILGNGWPIKCSYTSLNGNAERYAWGTHHLPNSSRHKHPPKNLHHYEQPYLKYIHAFAHREFVPSATTQSQAEGEPFLSPKYIQYLCRIYGQQGARGVSLFFASGDFGNNAHVRKGKKVLYPYWPASCPFVTAVGATVLASSIEVPTTYDTRKYQGGFKFTIASGGGFSQVFPIPAYQQADVPAYLKAHHIIRRFRNVRFSGTGRGYPDIALFGQRIPGFGKGKVIHTGGTSVSSPTAAVLIARLNAYEQSRGRPPLGFVNPWLYKNPHLLNDLVLGGSNEPFGDPWGPRLKKLGYPVAKGWDAVSGLGSFRFDKMLQSLEDMAAAGALG